MLSCNPTPHLARLSTREFWYLGIWETSTLKSQLSNKVPYLLHQMAQFSRPPGLPHPPTHYHSRVSFKDAIPQTFILHAKTLKKAHHFSLSRITAPNRTTTNLDDIPLAIPSDTPKTCKTQVPKWDPVKIKFIPTNWRRDPFQYHSNTMGRIRNAWYPVSNEAHPSTIWEFLCGE